MNLLDKFSSEENVYQRLHLKLVWSVEIVLHNRRQIPSYIPVKKKKKKVKPLELKQPILKLWLKYFLLKQKKKELINESNFDNIC